MIKSFLPSFILLLILAASAAFFLPREQVVFEDKRTEPPSLDIPLGAPNTPTIEEFIAVLESEQEALLAKYGEYISTDESGNLYYKDQLINESKFKNKIPPNTKINVYDGPKGKGFMVSHRTGDLVTVYGFGPEANELSTQYFDTKWASTTP